MEILACPKCGAVWFVSTRSGARIAFQVDDNFQPIVAEPDELPADAVPIDPGHIYCGACSWQGPITELVESRV